MFFFFWGGGYFCAGGGFHSDMNWYRVECYWVSRHAGQFLVESPFLKVLYSYRHRCRYFFNVPTYASFRQYLQHIFTIIAHEPFITIIVTPPLARVSSCKRKSQGAMRHLNRKTIWSNSARGSDQHILVQTILRILTCRYILG